MRRFRFKKGLRFNEDARQWTLLRELPTRKLLLQDSEGAFRQLTKNELLVLWNSGTWRVDDSCLEEINDVIYMATPGDLETYTLSQQKDAIRKSTYLTELSNDMCASSAGRLRAKIAEVAQKIGDLVPPHVATLKRWYRAWGHSKDSTRLIDQRRRSGRRPNAGAYFFFEKAIDSVYLTTQKKPKSEVLAYIARAIQKSNMKAPPEGQVALPSKSTVYRWLDDLNTYLVDEARLGKDAAKRNFSSSSGTVDVSHILERVEIDHTPLDLILIDELTMLPIGRPWLTLAIDRYSRAILGFYLAFHAPSSYSVMRCLSRCVLPKSEWMRGLGQFKNDWPMHGIPMEVVFDNGMDLHSKAVHKICFEMGCRVSFCPTGEPYFKGAIERMFRTLNTGLVHQLPGTTFSNPEERGDYPSEALATLTLPAATYLIAKWIVDVYHQRKHRGIGETPHARWSRQLAHTAIEFPAHPEDLTNLVGIPAQRKKISGEGIQYDIIFYNNSDLQNLRERLKRKKAAEFKYFEEDVGYIQVWDPEHEEYIRVEAIPKFAKYANGLSRQLHLVTRRWGEKTYGDDWMDHSLLESKSDIEGFVEDAKRAKKMATRKKAAALSQVSSEQRGDLLDTVKHARTPRPAATSYPPEFARTAETDLLPTFGINRTAGIPKTSAANP